MGKELNNYLKKYFGYSSFRSGQEEIIESILSGKNTLAVMPTGGGKSICYQLPALIKDGIAIIISPLIALMKDQVDALEKNNIPAVFINSSLSTEEVALKFEQIRNKEFKMVYIAPERIESKRFINLMNEVKTSFIAVDEAHCISEWGHDFRPSYLLVPNLSKELGNPPIIALTATATPEVQEDIIKQLNMNNTNRFITGFNRPNLSYFSENCTDKAYRITEIIKSSELGSNMIYCGSRKKVESLTDSLKKLGIKAGYYHAGLKDNFRKQAQDDFFKKDNSVIVATNAFGMGIDKSNVRNVIHCDFTQTLESYYQEAGRAGRDGKESKCTILYQEEDKDLQLFFINSNYPSKQDIAKLYEYLYELTGATYGQRPDNQIFLDDYAIAERVKLPLFTVTSIMKLFAKHRIMAKGNSRINPSVKFTSTPRRIQEYLKSQDMQKSFILESLLRFVPSNAFQEEIEFDLNRFLYKYNLKADEVKAALQNYNFSNILEYHGAGSSEGIYFYKERTGIDYTGIDFDDLERRKNNAFKKLDLVEEYIYTANCKRNYILNYFGEDDIKEKCGKCSSCLSPEKNKQIESRAAFIKKNLLLVVHNFNESFARSVLLDLLLGKNSKAVLAFKLDKFDLFGICKEIPEELVSEIFNKCIIQGLVRYGDDTYRKISITDKGSEYIAKSAPQKFIYDRTKKKAEYDESLYKKLLALRQGLALKERVQERGIISDIMLKKIAVSPPRSIKEMELIGSLGKLFMLNFAEYFLNIINKHYAIPERKNIPDYLVPLYEDTLEKLPIADICKKHKLTLVEFSRHIQSIIELGYLPNYKVYSNTKLIEILAPKMDTFKHLNLKEVRSKLDLDCEFYELRIALAYLKCTKFKY